MPLYIRTEVQELLLRVVLASMRWRENYPESRATLSLRGVPYRTTLLAIRALPRTVDSRQVKICGRHKC